jgi:AraC-like DNA-binding protein
VQKIGFECKVIGMSDRFRVSRLVARQPKEHGIPELAVLRRAGLWDGWLWQEKILWLGCWNAVLPVARGIDPSPQPARGTGGTFPVPGLNFGAERNALIFRSTDLDRPFITHNPELLDLITPQMDADLAANQSRRNVVDDVKNTIKRLLAGRRPTLADIARNLGLSTRTLQRQLAGLHITFQQLLQEARQEMVQQYLTQKSLDLNEVAYLVGFEDANSFFRAFQRWEGVSPHRWRCRRMNQPPAAMDSAGR